MKSQVFETYSFIHILLIFNIVVLFTKTSFHKVIEKFHNFLWTKQPAKNSKFILCTLICFQEDQSFISKAGQLNLKNAKLRYMRYILVLFVCTEFNAYARVERTFIYETANKRAIFGDYNKVCDYFRHHIFFHQPRPTNTE